MSVGVQCRGSLNMGCPALTSSGGSEMPPVSSPRSSHTIAVVEEMPPVSSPQLDSGPEAMLVSDPACHNIAPTEGTGMRPVSSPKIDNNIGSGVTPTSVSGNNIYTGPGVTSTPGPSNNINTGPGVMLTPVPNNHYINNNLVEWGEILSVSSPLSRWETESTMHSLSQSSSVAAVDTNTGWQTPRPFPSSSFPAVEGGDESLFGSVLSTPEFLPSPASSTGRFEALIGGAPVASVSQSEPLDTIEAINRAILTNSTVFSSLWSCLSLSWSPIMDLRIISLNINSLSDHLKQTAPVDWLKCMKVDVVCLQETHSPSHEFARKWFANSSYPVASSSLTSKSAGVAILVKDNYKITKIIKDEDGHYVQAVVDFGEGQASFVSLYALNRNPARNTFLAPLTGLIDLSRPTFVAGDFNSVLDPQLDRMRDPSYVAGPGAQQRESIVALESLVSFTQTYPLWRQLHPGRTVYSWTHGDGAQASRIDVVWAPTALSKNIKGCEYHLSFLSDHQYLLVVFSIQPQFNSGRRCGS